MSPFHNPLVILALIVCLAVGWFANELWNWIIFQVREATYTAGGWLHDLVYGIGWCAVGALALGAVGLWQGWWG